MGARDLLCELAAAGVSVVADGDRLVIRPASKLTNDQRTALRQAKPDILALLMPIAPAHPIHAAPWTEAECTRFSARVVLFLRRGLTAGDADDLAERLTTLDRDRCGLRLCLECANLAGHASSAWRCRRPRQAGVAAALPDELVRLGQRCPAFADALETEPSLAADARRGLELKTVKEDQAQLEHRAAESVSSATEAIGGIAKAGARIAKALATLHIELDEVESLAS